MDSMTLWTALTGGGSRWDADTPKPSRSQGAKDLVGWRSSSRANHEPKAEAEADRKAARKAKKAANKAAGKFFT